MFGNWLLSYNDQLVNNYNNPEVLPYFRRAARLALALRRLSADGVFTDAIDQFDSSEKITLSQFFNKNNLFALAISLHNLGEYFQLHHQYDVAVNLWEVNCHLTKDAESGNLAILGLSDGFGFGNKFKTLNKLGKKSKTNKYNTKRRIAQLYRILIENGLNDDVGTSWVWKKKYD